MSGRPQNHRVEVTFQGSAPGRQVERAPGVSEVEVDGSTLRCQVGGSFQPFLEALRGYEVISLTSRPAVDCDRFQTLKEVNSGTI